MRIERALFILGCIFIYSIPVNVSAKAIVEYSSPKSQSESAIVKELKSDGSVDAVINLINESFTLPQELKFTFGGEDGPLYDSSTNQIIIPYFFIEEVKQRFTKDKYSKTGVSEKQATMDSLMHTMFHEFAHAIIFMYEIPVLGKEEDAADGLASVLLIEFFEGGQEIAISAADLFDLESEDRDELDEQDFWGEHSLDLQRYYGTLCHVYGSDPEKYKAILERDYFSERRADLCIQEYDSLLRSVQKLLAPYLKDTG